MKPAALMGRLANGFERGAGTRIHLVDDDVEQYAHGRALCGAQPGRRSCGWDVDHYIGQAVSCPVCCARSNRRALRQLEVMTKALGRAFPETKY